MREYESKCKKSSKTFSGKREVSLQESVYRVLSLPLCYKSKNVLFINTHLREKRDLVPKKKAELDFMADDDENVFEDTLHDRYEARPDSWESTCLADFGTWYEYRKQQPVQGVKLKNGMGYMARRRNQSVLRIHTEAKNTEAYYQQQLMLFFPYRKESDLMGGKKSYAEHFVDVADTIENNSASYNMFQDEINEALIEYGKEKDKDEVNTWQKALGDEEEKGPVSTLTKKFQSDAKKEGKMSPSEYITKVRSSNAKQKEIVMWCRHHVKKQIFEMKRGNSPDGFRIVLTGPGGTGKSHVISLINHDVVDLFRRTNSIDPNDTFEEGRNAEKPTALLTAMTGTAAFNIGGSTLHSVLLLHQPVLPKEKACVLQSQLHQVQLLTIDEFSMMGAQHLMLANSRCCFVKQNITSDTIKNDNIRNFGKVNVLLVGDLYQLPAVRQTPIYKNSTDQETGRLSRTTFP